MTSLLLVYVVVVTYTDVTPAGSFPALMKGGEPRGSLGDHLGALAERESDERRRRPPCRRRTLWSGSRPPRSASGSAAQNATASLADVGVDEVRARRPQRAQAGGVQARAQLVALDPQIVAERLDRRRRQPQRRGGGVLERRAAGERQELLDRPAAATSCAGPEHHPIFHPVNENDLPMLEIVSVRDAIPGNVAIGMCSPS